MIKTFVMTAAAVMALAFISLLAGGQTPAPRLNHFSKSGLSFDYPADVKFEDKSETAGQQLVLTCAGGAQIMVTSRYEMIDTAAQLAKARADLFDSFVNSLVNEFERQQAKVERSEKQIEIGGAQASGVRLRAVLGGEPGNAEAYSLLLGRRLVMVTLIGSDQELKAGATAWALVRGSLQVGEMTRPAASPSDMNAMLTAGTLEGSTYTNSYFGLRLTFPDGWEAQDDRTKQKIRDRGKETITIDDPTKQARMNESVSNTVNLLMLFETPFVQPYRAKLVCVVEKIPGGVTFTEAGYADAVRIQDEIDGREGNAADHFGPGIFFQDIFYF